MSEAANHSVKESLFEQKGGKRHQWIVIASAFVAVITAMVLPPLTMEQQFWIVVVPIGVFGLSHGGADPLILKSLAVNHPGRFALMTGLYTLASLAFVGLIWWFPLVALIAFLLLSIWHFGYTDATFLGSQSGRILVWLCGSLPIIGPVVGHPEQTSELFAWLITYDPQRVLSVLKPIGLSIAALWLMGFIWMAYRDYEHLQWRVVSELVLVAAALLLLPPLLAFAFYFCVVHSTRHFLSVAQEGLGRAELKSTLAFLVRKAAPATIGALILAVAAWATITVFNPGSDLLVEAIRVMFWALAALTLPHALIVKIWWERPSQIREPH